MLGTINYFSLMRRARMSLELRVSGVRPSGSQIPPSSVRSVVKFLY
jgi:hypothetical protein